MNKPELMEEVRYHRQKEEEYENLIKELKHDAKGIKDELNEIKSRRGSTSVRDDFETKLVHIERRLAEQEQYIRVESFPEFPRENTCGGVSSLLEERLWRRFFPVSAGFAKLMGLPLFKEDPGRLLLLLRIRVLLTNSIL